MFDLGVDVNGGVSPLFDMIGAHVGVLFSLKCAPVLCVLFLPHTCEASSITPRFLADFLFSNIMTG